MKKRKVGETSEGIILERRTKAKHDGVAPDKKQKGVQEKNKKLATKIKKIDVVVDEAKENFKLLKVECHPILCT